METPFVLAIVILFGLCIIMASMQKKGTLTANRFALICVAYFSYFAISAINADHPLLSTGDLKFEIMLLFGIWIFVYPMARWLYGQWNSQSH